MKYVVDLKEVNLSDLELVGGKNASSGEMIQSLSAEGIKVPEGLATTVNAFYQFLSQQGLDKKISQVLAKLKIQNVKELDKVSAQIRRWIVATPFLPEFERDIATAFVRYSKTTVAVRSSATVEDLPTASFAGQQETFLNVKGLKNVLHAIKLVFASLYTSRAIAYRCHHGFNHKKFAISAGIQPMVRSDKGTSGVIFTLDTESGFDRVVLITASYGLGEAIVQGHVNPDEFYVHKPMLAAHRFSILQRKLGEKAIKMVYGGTKNPREFIKTVSVPDNQRLRYCIDDNDVHALAKYAIIIEKHYGKPMDIEWAKDGITGELYIVQARPETVKSRVQPEQVIERYTLVKKGEVLTSGQSIGQRLGQGIARIILDPKKMRGITSGEILVTDMTDPDWEPIMKKASAIVTNRGGRTCHAAIVARELGIPAIVGCSNATTMVKENQSITVSCSEGQTGYVYAGKLPYRVSKLSIKDMPKLPVQLCMNVANPERVFDVQHLPNDGVGLARLEFIISNSIGIHPNAALKFKTLPKLLQQQIRKKTAAYTSPVEFYVEKLREGISTIAAVFYPKQVIFRFSDFKSNEYANLLGGDLFEPKEENPMLGFRGASRYKDARFRQCFELECKAFKRVRDDMGLVNAQIMVPFVRTVEELRQVIELIETYGLKRSVNNLKVYMMCEVPSNVLLAEEFLQYVDGFSIGSNDLTQLTLGLDRDSGIVASLFDERNDAVKVLLHKAISICKSKGKYVSICGQGPSDHPDFALWLVEEGIDAISLNPDSLLETWLLLGEGLKKSERVFSYAV
ncbi:MAG: phosphoenolpyruvate synthase [Gammaproteobacteria bacterium RIFCSPHIGHO2_12_FULL_41_20]|nr:MAG: phosphoenolpyruvate synthase [Gammaproteobacteria bacterium RIFCSPHIGHO2_12_FULL_41_20]